MAVTPLKPGTVTGIGLACVVQLLPQHCTVPFASSEHVWVWPAATAGVEAISAWRVTAVRSPENSREDRSEVALGPQETTTERIHSPLTDQAFMSLSLPPGCGNH